MDDAGHGGGDSLMAAIDRALRQFAETDRLSAGHRCER